MTIKKFFFRANTDDLKWCSSCLSMSTRPRITFDERGFCNACRWMEKKEFVDWSYREKQLTDLLDKHRSKSSGFDCMVPVSGGKDGSYVAYNLKHKYGMNPIALTITPALALDLGDKNLKAFIASGYNHISVNPDYESMRVLNKQGFIEMGFPYFGWLISIQAAVVKMALQLGISLIFYGEDGEVEYGGSEETNNTPIYDVDYMKKIYLEGGFDKVLDASNLTESDLYFFRFPNEEVLASNPIDITHWSYFESWDPYRNYLVAKKECGLIEAEESNAGTFTNYSQNDQALYALHTYMMYLKLGFGRANQDACIEIRRGAMDREQAVNLVNLYDGHYPKEFIELYLSYYQMTLQEFNDVIDSWANEDLFKKIDGYWKPKFKVK